MLDNKVVLVTGGTGSFGQNMVNTILHQYKPRKLIVFSRDELKQYEMRQTFSPEVYPCMRYFIGDVRDRDRLQRAFYGVDVIIHAAALKQVDTSEYNPFEVIKTNILGASNIIDAAIDAGVDKVIALSSDKAANPINLYGATKLCADKLFIAANTYSAKKRTRFSIVRYGNVIGSRGSVVPLFIKQKETGTLTITHPDMTRFWITLDQAVAFVLQCLGHSKGGEVFIPKLPSMKILDLATAIAPESEIKTIGVRPGEKMHEVMIPSDEALQAREYSDRYTIYPAFQYWGHNENGGTQTGKPLPENFQYSSDNNDNWLTVGDLGKLIADIR